jgi:hypothetical protein
LGIWLRVHPWLSLRMPVSHIQLSVLHLSLERDRVWADASESAVKCRRALPPLAIRHQVRSIRMCHRQVVVCPPDLLGRLRVSLGSGSSCVWQKRSQDRDVATPPTPRGVAVAPATMAMTMSALPRASSGRRRPPPIPPIYACELEVPTASASAASATSGTFRPLLVHARRPRQCNPASTRDLTVTLRRPSSDACRYGARLRLIAAGATWLKLWCG